MARAVRVSIEDIERHLARGGTINGGKRSFTLSRPVQPVKEKSSSLFAAGRRPDLENRYFRSAWEANVARYLNFLCTHGKIHHWEYEVDEFEFPVKRGAGKFYKPDFKVWLTEDRFEYWEVKGHMDTKSATKLKRMQRYYPQYRVVIIDEHRYRSEICPIRALLPGWESEAA